MKNYFRITAHNKKENITIIIDTNNKFEELWQYAYDIMEKGFEVLKVHKSQNIDEGNMPLLEEQSDKYYLRAYETGLPTIKTCSYKNKKAEEVSLGIKNYYII